MELPNRKISSMLHLRRHGCLAAKRTVVSHPVPSESMIRVRGQQVTVVDSVDSARRVLSVLRSLPSSSVVAWNIEATDVDTKRFHTAGTGGRVLCATCTAKEADFGNGSRSVFIDAMPLSMDSDGEDSDMQTSGLLDEFADYFQDPARLKCSHSVADDYHVLLQHGITLAGVEADTRYLARLYNTALSSWEGRLASPNIEDEEKTDAAPLERGYDLRASVASLEVGAGGWEFCDKKLDRFLKRLNGPKIAQLSPTMRPYWIGKTVESALFTMDLFEFLKHKLEEAEWRSAVFSSPDPRTMWDLARVVHKPLLAVLSEVEHTGMALDESLLEKVRKETEKIVNFHTSQFRNICGNMRDPSDASRFLNADADLINPHSAQHVRQLLFGYPSERQSEWFSYKSRKDKRKIPNRATFGDITISGIGLRPIKSKLNRKRLADYSAKGVPSVNQKLLSEYAGADPDRGEFGRAADPDQLEKFGKEYVAQSCRMLFHLLNVGKYQYVLSSFLDPLIEKTVNGRIHPSLSLDTSTGRLACKKPNLHNPPNASDTLGLRAVFTAGSGNTLIVADYSQLELRILAHVTNCDSMIRSLNAGGDYHSWTAVDMFGHVRKAVESGACSVHDVKRNFPSERAKAKAVNFSIAYGKCARSIAEDMDCQLAEAEQLLATWYATKPEVAAWKADTVFKARVAKKVESILGRTRDIPHIDKALWKGRSERAAVNHCIQGSGADIAICAMIQIGQSAELKKLGFKLLMQIHDEFILEGPEAHAQEARKILVDLMQNPFRMINPEYKFKVPLEVDAGIGRNWLVAKP